MALGFAGVSRNELATTTLWELELKFEISDDFFYVFTVLLSSFLIDFISIHSFFQFLSF
jgi:hypothetical protein